MIATGHRVVLVACKEDGDVVGGVPFEGIQNVAFVEHADVSNWYDVGLELDGVTVSFPFEQRSIEPAFRYIRAKKPGGGCPAAGRFAVGALEHVNKG